MTSATDDYPEIPNQKAFTIGEASKLCRATLNQLRYWEKVYPQHLGKVKRVKDRRYYGVEELVIIRTIRDLSDQGLSSKAIKAALSSKNSEPASIHATLMSADAVKKEINSVIKLLS